MISNSYKIKTKRNYTLIIIFFNNVSKLTIKIGTFINIEKKKVGLNFVTPIITKKISIF